MEFTVMDTNNPGKNPASDGTVAAIHQVSSCLGVSFKQTLRPVVLYEYNQWYIPIHELSVEEILLNYLFKDTTASVNTRSIHVYSV